MAIDIFKLKIIQHANISKSELDEIIHIKSVAWPYPYEKQIEWIHEHLKNSDFHVLLFEESRVVAYLNLIDINLFIDNKKTSALGVGNVCALTKGKGYGSELMKKNNQFLIDQNKIGLLFCNKNLVVFYKTNNWKLGERCKLLIPSSKKHPNTMIFNLKESFNKLEYIGELF